MDRESMERAPSRGSRTATLAIVLALLAFSIVIVYEASYLNWPLSFKGSGVGIQSSSTSSQSTASANSPNATLQVLVLQTNNTSGPSPFFGALISVYTQDTPSKLVSTGATDAPDGIVVFNLFPATYVVKIAATISVFQPINVVVYNSSTTILKAYINSTAYIATFFDIVNPDATSNLPPWSQIFIQVNSDSILPLNSARIFLSLFPFPSDSTSFFNSTQVTTVRTAQPPNTLGITVLSQIPTNGGKLSLQVKLNSTADLSSVKELGLLTIQNYYSIKAFSNLNGSLIVTTTIQTGNLSTAT